MSGASSEVDTVVFDLDGTLANCDHRVHLAQAKQWDEFHSLLHLDALHVRAAQVFALLEPAHVMLVVTGRPERYRTPTERWLMQHLIPPDALLMRPNDDWRSDSPMKLDLLVGHFGSLERAVRHTLLVVEDRDSMVEAYRHHGFECWQCRAGAY